MQINEWIETQLGQDIWNKKYKYENETFDGWLDRVSGGNKNIKQLIEEKKFLFGGRILASRGLQNKGRKITLSNCYVITSPEDNIESIFDCAKKLARTYSYGGGCGIDISKLSPRNSKINNAAKETSGSVSFMDLYSLVTELIGQSGRRGALMISIDCNHPDLEEFINIKSDLNKITKANISIKITDDFMKAVENNQDWELSYTRKETNECIKKTIKASELFGLLAKMNWDYAEPGILNWDRITNWNLLSEDDEFEYAGVNPCFTGDMKLLTSRGYKSFEELCDNNIDILNINGDISSGKVWYSGEKEIIELTLSNKQKIKCTPNHIFMLNDGSEIEAQNTINKRIQIYYGKTNMSEDLYVKLGFIQGDGDIGRINSENHKGLEINLGNNDNEIFDLFGITPIEGKHAYYTHGYNDILIKMGFDGSQLPERLFPITYTNWSKDQKANFLKGCYSANGSIIKKHRVSYKTTSKVFALQLQKALIEFGITANITNNKPKMVKFKNGEYLCKESFDININKLNDIIIFYQNIGFIQNYKIKDLIDLIKIKSPTVISIKKLGVEKVYDFTEPLTHWGVVENIIVHNCAEEPLPAGGSCLLGSINLSEFIIYPFTHNARFDYESFEYAVKQGVIALNEVLHEGLPLHPLEEQKESVNNWRQIGLGLFGWHDALIKLGIRYGSEDSLSIANDIGFTMIDTAIETSANLTDIYEKYPKYNESAIFTSQFFINNTTSITRKTVQEKGLANSQLLTIAPTGSIGTMLGVSTGLEPIYNISYTRKTESLHGKEESYKVYTPIVEKYMNINNIKTEEDLPDFINTAMTLNYKERINMQSTWQNYIDASISSTVNVSSNFTVNEVKDLYLLAWKKGLKGVTIFRDDCARLGILTNDKPKEKEEKLEYEELPRGYIEEVPEGLVYRKYKLKTGCGNLYFFVGIDETEGKIYDCFTNTDGVGGCTINTQANSRLLSASLRGGVPVIYLIEQLSKSGVCSSFQYKRGKGDKLSKGKSCPSAIANVLKDIMKEFELNELPEDIKKTKSNKLCPECKETLVFEGGCNICKSCGYSKCS